MLQLIRKPFHRARCEVDRLFKILFVDCFDFIFCHWAYFVRDGFVKFLLYCVPATGESGAAAGVVQKRYLEARAKTS